MKRSESAAECMNSPYSHFIGSAKNRWKRKLSIIEYQGKPLSQSLDLCRQGGVSLEEFKKRYIPPKCNGFQYPLVIKYRDDAVNTDGQILLLEIAP